MTGRASFLRRLRVLEDRARLRASVGAVTQGHIVRALEVLEDGPLSRLEEALSAGRVGEGGALGGPLALRVLALEDPQTEEAAVWARAYLSGEDLPPLPDGAALAFGDRAADLEDLTRDTVTGEEKTRLEDAAAVWATLEALARVLEEKGEA